MTARGHHLAPRGLLDEARQLDRQRRGDRDGEAVVQHRARPQPLRQGSTGGVGSNKPPVILATHSVVRSSQLVHHRRHPVLIDMGVNLRRRQVHMPQQGPNVHQLGPGVEPVGGVGVAQLVR